MGARYSDRFFGPEDGRHTDQGTDQPEHPERPLRLDVLGLAGTDDAPSPPDVVAVDARGTGRPPWHRGGAARAAVAAALVIGAAAGAYGWDSWRDHEVEVLARATVDVSSAASIVSMGPAIDELAVSVRLTNDGTHPLTVTAVDPADARLVTTDEPPGPEALFPAADYTRVLHLRLDCTRPAPAGDSAASDSPLVARLRTVDGANHATPLHVNGFGGTFSQLVADQCMYATQEASGFAQYWAGVESAEPTEPDGVSVTVTLQSGTGSSERPSIQVVDARGDSFAARWEPAVLVDRGAAGYAIRVVLTVEECAAALTAGPEDMEVAIDGQLTDAETAATIFATPTAELATELVRLVDRVCS